ncbi:hypothetical protein DEH84_06875 [Aquabacterium olei]|uniref:Uncharacterized protein n=1 Tax=Aquabacterium olei TaxID=1296669 RepID=A0A2U8FQ47_9BURK|nr:hypothetical protein [Aquabacterium olei]AWI53182.1 hypothetical protein DEH84_06875 [Aquabacterium olei]
MSSLSAARALAAAINVPQGDKTPPEVRQLLAAFASIKPAPCSDCERSGRCAADRTACWSFVAYVQTGKRQKEYLRVFPSRELFDLAQRSEAGPDDPLPDMPPRLAALVEARRHEQVQASKRRLAEATARKRAAKAEAMGGAS